MALLQAKNVVNILFTKNAFND